MRKLNPGLLERWHRSEMPMWMAVPVGLGLGLVVAGLAIVCGALCYHGVPLW